MSLTISATPFLLIMALGNIIDAAGIIVKGTSFKYKEGNYVHFDKKEIEAFEKKEFKTQIMDKTTLIKTLEEHGATEVEDKGEVVMCRCDAFYLTFTKQSDAEPYTMTAIFNSENGLDELVGELGEEYAINAQEVSYNKIKERLENQNLTISQEEVFDDNTIVLTVDLD